VEKMGFAQPRRTLNEQRIEFGAKVPTEISGCSIGKAVKGSHYIGFESLRAIKDCNEWNIAKRWMSPLRGFAPTIRHLQDDPYTAIHLSAACLDGCKVMFLNPVVMESAGSLQYKVAALKGSNLQDLNPLQKLLRA
jgi:hypothetical protein